MLISVISSDLKSKTEMNNLIKSEERIFSEASFNNEVIYSKVKEGFGNKWSFSLLRKF